MQIPEGSIELEVCQRNSKDFRLGDEALVQEKGIIRKIWRMPDGRTLLELSCEGGDILVSWGRLMHVTKKRENIY